MEIIMRKFTKITIVTVALVSAGAMAFATPLAQAITVTVPPAKFSLTQAIAAAEQQFNGKATRAEYEKTKTGWTYDVEVINGTKVFDIRIDADKGTVISSLEAKAGRDEEDDNENDKQD
jgi:Peptidase propeptide and YPEB domain